MKSKKNPAAVALGRKGGLVKSEAKRQAAKRNLAKRWAEHNARKENAK